MIGSAAASAGLFSLASCGEAKKKRIIFYFTGTGNCLYIARQLAGEGAELLSIPQMVKRGRYEFAADEIGIVWPVYGHMPPYMVRQFIQRAKLVASYKFAVLTYGARKCDSVETWDNLSRGAGNVFDYIGTLMMVDNWLPNFDMNEQTKVDKHIPENLQRITADIAAKRCWVEPVTQEERLQHQEFMRRSGLDPNVGFLMKAEKSFKVSGDCISCGICTYVCPRGNWELTSKGVEAQGDCEFCFACIQNCPQRAIGFADRQEVNPNARYRNEHVSLMDLKLANNQKM